VGGLGFLHPGLGLFGHRFILSRPAAGHFAGGLFKFRAANLK
jgi:hypothetical protein